MVDITDFQKAADMINRSTSALITAHTRPDGDACGSMKAIAETLQVLGKKTEMLFLSPLPPWYEFMFSDPVAVLGNDVDLRQLEISLQDEFDLVIIVDTDSYVQLPEFDKLLKQSHQKVLVMDHHVTGDGLGDVSLIDSSAAATGEIVYDFLKFADLPVTESIAEALFIAISTDTGWFKFANADARLFRNAADLIDAGAKPAELFKKLYMNFSPQRMRLMIRMFEHMELYFDNRLAIQYILRKDFDETGATGSDTENLINECQRIQTVQAAALLVELADGGFRCSLRSKGRVDVRKIAQDNGGGGHTMASGVNLPGPIDTARKIIIDAVRRQIES